MILRILLGRYVLKSSYKLALYCSFNSMATMTTADSLRAFFCACVSLEQFPPAYRLNMCQLCLRKLSIVGLKQDEYERLKKLQTTVPLWLFHLQTRPHRGLVFLSRFMLLSKQTIFLSFVFQGRSMYLNHCSLIVIRKAPIPSWI